MTRLRLTLLVSALGVVVALVFLPAITAPLFWDDHVYRFFVLELPFAETLTRGLFGVYFRPLATALWWLAARAFGEHAVGYHLLALGLHLVTAALVAVVAVRTRPAAPARVGPALAAATLFALTPVAASTTAWAANLATLLATALGLAALAAAAASRPRVAVCAALLLAAMASKEDAVVFLVPALFLVWRAGAGRRPGAVALLLAAPVAALAWRAAAIGLGPGLVAAPRSGMPAKALAVAALALVVAVIAVWRATRSDGRVALLLLMPATALAALLLATLPPVPYGLSLRLLYPASVGAALLVAAALAATSERRPRWRPALALLMVTATAAAAAGSARHLRGWTTVTRASAELVAATATAIDGERGLHGPVWIRAEADEIALDPAVKLLRPEWRRSLVLLRPVGLSFLAVPPELWPAVAREVTPWAIPGNPAVGADWVGAAVHARSARYRAAAEGRSDVPVIAPQVGADAPPAP